MFLKSPHERDGCAGPRNATGSAILLVVGIFVIIGPVYSAIRLIQFFRSVGFAAKHPKEICVGKWLRSIERGFAQAENNHFKPLIRTEP
jgi:hypothetical protein